MGLGFSGFLQCYNFSDILNQMRKLTKEQISFWEKVEKIFPDQPFGERDSGNHIEGVLNFPFSELDKFLGIKQLIEPKKGNKLDPNDLDYAKVDSEDFPSTKIKNINYSALIKLQVQKEKVQEYFIDPSLKLTGKKVHQINFIEIENVSGVKRISLRHIFGLDKKSPRMTDKSFEVRLEGLTKYLRENLKKDEGIISEFRKDFELLDFYNKEANLDRVEKISKK